MSCNSSQVIIAAHNCHKIRPKTISLCMKKKIRDWFQHRGRRQNNTYRTVYVFFDLTSFIFLLFGMFYWITYHSLSLQCSFFVIYQKSDFNTEFRHLVLEEICWGCVMHCNWRLGELLSTVSIMVTQRLLTSASWGRALWPL